MRKRRNDATSVHDELAKLETVSGPTLRKLGDLLEGSVSGNELERMYEGAGFSQIGIAAATGISTRTMRNAINARKVRKPIELAVRHVLHLLQVSTK
jgi:hypothetical protein